MAHPFENEDELYLVLMNDDGQYSIWPAFAEIPRGWTVVYEKNRRGECLDYIESHWSDMRPNRVKSTGEGKGR